MIRRANDHGDAGKLPYEEGDSVEEVQTSIVNVDTPVTGRCVNFESQTFLESSPCGVRQLASQGHRRLIQVGGCDC